MYQIPTKKIISLAILASAMNVHAETVEISFGNADLSGSGTVAYTGPGGGRYWNGSDSSGAFRLGGLVFPNAYNATFGSWSGFSVSGTSDTETAGFGNQFSAITGAGVDGPTYVVASPSSFGIASVLEVPAQVTAVNSITITNTSYAGLSMANGDDFAKKFGDDPATEGTVETNYPDWFLLTITGYAADETVTGTVEFYLADFRSETDSEDYIVDTWTSVDLSSLGDVVKIGFELSSSDVGDFGMNTPASFAIGGLEVEGTTFAGFLVEDNGWINTGSLMGYGYPVGQWLYVFDLGKYVYVPESEDATDGAWVYVAK